MEENKNSTGPVDETPKEVEQPTTSPQGDGAGDEKPVEEVKEPVAAE